MDKYILVQWYTQAYTIINYYAAYLLYYPATLSIVAIGARTLLASNVI